MLKNYGKKSSKLDENQRMIIESALKAAVLVSDTPVILPVIDLVESFQLISGIDFFYTLVEYGEISYSGSEIDADKIIAEKRNHFRNTSFYPGYFDNNTMKLLRGNTKYIQKRRISTTKDLIVKWNNVFANNTWENDWKIKLLLHNAEGKASPSKIVDELVNIPEKLDGRAFLWDVLLSINALKKIQNTKEVDTAARFLLGKLWLMSHLDEYNSILIYDIPGLGKLDCNLSTETASYSLLSFYKILNIFKFYGINSIIQQMSIDELMQIKYSADWNYFKHNILFEKLKVKVIETDKLLNLDRQWLFYVNSGQRVNKFPTFKQVVGRFEVISNLANGDKSKKNYTLNSGHKSEILNTKTINMSKPRIFIVHGWKHDIRDKLALYLEKELDLQTIIMQDEPFKGKTLPEKFESLASESDFAIILATADEELTDSSGSRINRMRPNVLLEIGFFWGMLGRERVALLVEPDMNVEIPTDLQGIGYSKISSDFDAVKHRIFAELKAAGIINRGKNEKFK